MLRPLLIASAFMVFILGLLMLQPNAQNGFGIGALENVTAAVTRADTENLTTMPKEEPLEERLHAALKPSTQAAPTAPAASNMEDLTQGVLAGLGIGASNPDDAQKPRFQSKKVTPVPAARPVPNDPLASMTQTALLSLGANPDKIVSQSALAKRQAEKMEAAARAAATPSPVPVKTDEDRQLERMIVAAIAGGNPDRNVDDLLVKAAQKGLIEVPEGMMTSQGEIDTQTLLLNIIENATGTVSVDRERLVTGGRGVEVRVIQEADRSVKYHFYTVNKGDSLGMISLKFYGTVTKFPDIFEANRTILSSPDMIRPGQRLVIPNIG